MSTLEHAKERVKEGVEHAKEWLHGGKKATGHEVTTALPGRGPSEKDLEVPAEKPTLEKLTADEKAMQEKRAALPVTKVPLACTTEGRVKLSNKIMLACQWDAAKKMSMHWRLVRAITDPEDVIVRVTSSTICGSDLHMLYDAVPAPGAMLQGDILGHEGVGIVDEVGPAVKNFKPGDRVVISALLRCGNCEFCKSDRPSLCEHTNPSRMMEELYGHRLAGVLGYTQLTGGYSGTQAEYVRVPLGDNNLLKLPDSVPDSVALLLSDVCCTGWHANEMAAVGKGDTVCVWGGGPVGMMACYHAKNVRGAKRVILVEHQQPRLELARTLGIETIDFQHKDVYDTLMAMTDGRGVDCVLECAGFRYSKSATQHAQGVAGMDCVDIISEMVKCCAKGGRMSLIGDYFGYSNAFPIGALMEKNITARGGQVFVQTYWKHLLDKIVDGTIDISWEITHQRPFEDAAKAYQQFAERVGGCMKIQLVTQFGAQQNAALLGTAKVGGVSVAGQTKAGSGGAGVSESKVQ